MVVGSAVQRRLPVEFDLAQCRLSNSRKVATVFPSGIAKKQGLGAEHRFKQAVIRFNSNSRA